MPLPTHPQRYCYPASLVMICNALNIRDNTILISFHLWNNIEQSDSFVKNTVRKDNNSRNLAINNGNEELNE